MRKRACTQTWRTAASWPMWIIAAAHEKNAIYIPRGGLRGRRLCSRIENVNKLILLNLHNYEQDNAGDRRPAIRGKQKKTGLGLFLFPGRCQGHPETRADEVKPSPPVHSGFPSPPSAEIRLRLARFSLSPHLRTPVPQSAADKRISPNR